MTEHTKLVHDKHYHDNDQYPMGCQFCDGGLYACTVCHGFEGTLTTDCCGRKLTEQEEKDIYAGRLDYNDEKGWILE